MATVWFIFAGPEQAGEPFAELTIQECKDKLLLDPSHRMPLREGDTPKFRELRDRLREPERVVVEIFDGEDSIWPAGFYNAPISPDEARRTLLD